MNSNTIPFVSFQKTNKKIKNEIMTAFEQFFDSSWYILGDNVKKFEAEYAAFNQVNHCVGVGNGLDALHIALKSLGVGKGDEVIVPSNTYIATALAVSYAGATPVFVEPDIHTYNIDTTKIETAITSKTKAIIPVHLYGQACEMDAVMAVAQKHNLFIIEDNAQAQGASFQGKSTGSFGHVNATSFYPAKNLGAFGDAGAITTNDKIFLEKALLLRNYGSCKKYYHEVKGINSRLDEVQASFLSVKLKHLEKWNEERKLIARRYKKKLKRIPDIVLPVIANSSTSVYHIFNIRTKKRNQLQKFLAQNGIETMIHYPIPVHLQKAYSELGYRKGAFPIAEEISETSLSLPIYPGLTLKEIEFICNTIKKFFNA